MKSQLSALILDKASIVVYFAVFGEPAIHGGARAMRFAHQARWQSWPSGNALFRLVYCEERWIPVVEILCQ
ncbi:hypothetical protein RP726_17105 [Candidatus Methylospira mobilis]|uniref:hypothetical protein n=1 Tax=Candidatus Methylospira mobilis TaxID=1808979 RepID=UPI0028EC5F9A|nr:hypothetical protein [Candidatus Methylospira mobilis]WNV04110.1 hypothetical protein RP726_17105 [Candidatus Methylospira mobilis]